MTATAQLLMQRSSGDVHLRMEKDGISVMREAGSSKCRMPRGTTEAILINTSGGLAGGDHIGIRAEAGRNASLTLTSQAAERVYRSLGPPADVSVALKAEAGATLAWLPQETIIFDGAALSRSFDVDLDTTANFLAVEMMVFGRQESGEALKALNVSDKWNIRQNGKLLHAERFVLDPEWSATPASFAVNRAMATLLLVSPYAEQILPKLRQKLGAEDGASAWNGKLVARFLAKDGFSLKKAVIPALAACSGSQGLPKCWTF